MSTMAAARNRLEMMSEIPDNTYMQKDESLWDNWEDHPNPYFTLDRKKSCIGKRVLVYHLTHPVQRSLFETHLTEGTLSFPLGEHYPFYSVDCPGKCTITGLLGNTELKMVPRIRADLLEVRIWFESALNSYGPEAVCSEP